jgi:hypothetical protein
MTLGNMRELGVRNLIAFCHNDACRHQALIDVSSYADDVEIPSFQRRVKCGKCGGRDVDVRHSGGEGGRPIGGWGVQRDQNRSAALTSQPSA